MTPEIINEYCKIYNRYNCAKIVAGIASDRDSAIKSLNALKQVAAQAGIDIEKEYLLFCEKERHE